MSVRILRFLFPLISLILLVFLLPVSVRADNGPHGGYTPTTDACAGCHRVHTASAGRLLLDTVPNLCYTCHGSAGTGADTNVSDGLYLERDSISETPPEGVPGQGLKGGGFVNAWMDTNRDGLSSSAPATSGHLVDGSLGIAWGNGALDSGPGIDMPLSCVSCHDPHGGGTYRILRPIPTGSGAGTPVAIPDEITKTYTVISATNAYIGEDYGALASPLANWCSQCHTRYMAASGSGHTDSGDSIFSYRHATANVSCVRCHVAHGSSAAMGSYSGAVHWPNGSPIPSGDARSSLLRLDNRGVCAYCHLSTDGTISGGACDSCHGAPPLTGAHARHTGPSGVGYGLVGSFATTDSYQFGCGECHPADSALHQNGTVEVVLSSAGAPAGSLKIQNAPAASYTGGSCGGVYCHSGIEVTSGPVGLPLTDGSGNYILDSHGNLTYDPYMVTEARQYQTTPLWDGGSITTCTACHPFPLTTSSPAVEAAVGSGHQWVDEYGYGNLHAYNMSFDPLSCRTCHYGEITQANTWTRDGMDVTTYNPAPLASYITHANGQREVVFDTVNPIVYDTYGGPVTYDLSTAAYLPTERTCTNVACHKLQTNVQWGTPYRWWTMECDLCHRYGLPDPPLLGLLDTLAKTRTHDGLNPTGQLCVDCHSDLHGGSQR